MVYLKIWGTPIGVMFGVSFIRKDNYGLFFAVVLRLSQRFALNGFVAIIFKCKNLENKISLCKFLTANLLVMKLVGCYYTCRNLSIGIAPQYCQSLHTE